VKRAKPLHVFFDDSIFHVQPVGGISRYVTCLTAALSASDQCRVTLFCGWSPAEIPARLRKIQNLRIFHLPRPTSWRVNTAAARLSGFWRRAVFRSERRTGEDSVYHPSFYTFDPFIAGSADAMVVTFHDMIAELCPEQSKRSVRHLEQKVNAGKRADGILTVSKSTFGDLTRLHPWTADKISVAHLATNLVASPRSPSVKWQQDVAGYFLIVGHRDHYKNGAMALRAFIEFSKRQGEENYGLVICGGGPLGENETQELEAMGLRSRVIWTSASDEELENLYSYAIALLYPSRYEGFGLPVLEAMACGCPVITTQVSSLPEVAGEACIYVDPDDSRQIADAMQSLTYDPQFRSQIISDSLKQSKKFSWARCANETITNYNNALTRRRGSESSCCQKSEASPIVLP
jgi:glycosyltransferase involved in cell wall biosynthesis